MPTDVEVGFGSERGKVMLGEKNGLSEQTLPVSMWY